MLVKIVAMGFSAGVWKEVFNRLRSRVPDQAFSVAVFSTPEELGLLEREFFPTQWRREAPDFLLCEGRSEGQPVPGGVFLSQVAGLADGVRGEWGLVFDSLEKGLKNALQVLPPVSLTLDNGGVFTLSDPAFLLRVFPPNFPRIRVNDHLTTLRLRPGAGGPGELRAQELPLGALVGFSEIDALIHQGQVRSPRDWLKQVVRAEGLKRTPKAAGLIRESKGVFLFPGIPLERVRGVEFGGHAFAHVLDLKKSGADSAQFEALVQAVGRTGLRQAEGREAFSLRIREAEVRADIPVVCGGGNPLLRESFTALLARRGFQRCFTLASPAEGIFREPSLLIQVAPWEQGELGVQADTPLVLDIGEELEARLAPLEGLLPWRALPYQPPPVDIPPLSPGAFRQQAKRLATRGGRAEKERALEEKKIPLLAQESAVLGAAARKLAGFFDPTGPLVAWDGTLAPGAGQVLLFSHDAEEAGAVFHSLSRVAKKKWIDLARFEGPDALQNLDLEEMKRYGQGGAVLITSAARERLQAAARAVEGALPEAEQALAQAQTHLERLVRETRAVAEAKEKLARNLVWETLAGWLEENREPFYRALEAVRERHERRWLNRSQVHRALIVPFRRDNGAPLLEACGDVFPGFNRDHSMVVPYEFDFLDELPPAEATALRQQGHEERLSPTGLEKREADALARHNETLFADYLQVMSGELAGARMDLVLVDHRPEIASRILAHLRNSLPQLKNVPAILLLSDFWAPQPDQPLPWPRTRVVLLRRMGALSAVDCARHLRNLYPM